MSTAPVYYPSAPQQPPPLRQYQVIIPQGVYPGMQFSVRIDGQVQTYNCPSNLKPGDVMRVSSASYPATTPQQSAYPGQQPPVHPLYPVQQQQPPAYQVQQQQAPSYPVQQQQPPAYQVQQQEPQSYPVQQQHYATPQPTVPLGIGEALGAFASSMLNSRVVVSSSSRKRPCRKCTGLGFIHESSMTHSKASDKRCFHCNDCSSCGGSGIMPDRLKHKQPCFKCRGVGSVHESSMSHNNSSDKACFFCTKCTTCNGDGLI